MNVFKAIILFFLIVVFQKVQSQTLIMNEVSNGPGGNKEYVEFVVVSSAVTYTCSSPTPPCIDIRGWIFDDNSGYHGTSGVATGAVRFANNPIWACVPLGTIILIYNNGDRNPAIPPDDLSMIDGNCTIIAPMNSTLFESNATTPGAIACSYPAVGWVPPGNWGNTVLANGGDCARIVDLGGCEVFSVCWDVDNLNNLIYFPGSAATRVYYFNDINPQLQANWTNASALTPGNETPGAPNNALNAAYIAQFNNGCLPITSISVTATSVNAGCTCTGSATANASGSIPGYTYLWSNGQTSATATGLCAGIYTVTATSHIGCSISTTVNITSSSSVSVTVNSQTICAGGSTILTASPSTLGGTYLWSPGGQTTQTISISPGATTTYSISYLLSGCSTSTTASVLVNPLPIVTVNSSTICVGQSATLTSAGATTYTWNTGSTLNPLTVSPITTTNFTVTGASAAGCTNTAVASVLVNPLPIVTVNSSTICVGQSATLTSAGATTYTWNTGSTLNPLTVSPLATTVYTVTGTTSGCTNTAVATVSVNPLPIVTVNSSTICVGQSATLTSAGATTYTWNTGSTLNPLTVSPLTTTNFTVTGTTAGCTNTAIATVSVNPLPIVTVNSSTICVGQSATLTSAGAATYTWNTGSILNPLTVSPLATTNYTVTGTTAGCTNTAVATVSVNPLPIVTVNSSTICVGQSATLTSAGATTYTWNTGSILNPLTVSPLTTTNFTVTGASAAGCTNTAVASVLVNPLPIVTVNSSTICVGQSAILTSAGATTYTWNTGSTLNPLTVSPLTTTNFTVTGASAAGCTNTAVASVLVNPLPIVTVNSSTICVGQSATLTSAGATTYTWNTGSILNPLTVSPLTTTNFTVTGTTAGCTNTAIATVSVNPLPIVTVNSSTICEGQSVTLTSAGATTYTWNTGSTLNPLTVSPLTTTNFTVTGTTAGCTNTAITTVSVNPLPIVTVNSSTICEGQSTTLTSAGATTYTWNTGSILNPLTVSPLTTTNFTVTGASAAGCTNTAVASVLVNPLPIVTVNSSTICVGQSATLTSAGATTYTWNTGSILNPLTVSPLTTTNFTVTGTTAGCTNTAVATVSVNPLPIVTVNSSTICEGQSTTLTSAGAITYTWNTGSTLNPLTVSPLTTTNFTVTGTTAGCTNTAIANVSVNPLPIVTVNSSTICEGQSTTLTSAGATTYAWNTGSTLNPLTVSPLATTIYTVTGTTAGCTNTAVATVSVNPLPIVTVNSSTICEGQSTTLTSTGATTYAWNTGSTLNPLTVSPLTTTNFTVTGTTAGCTNTAVASVLVNPLPIVTVNSSTICVGQSATLTSAGATTYTWNTGSTLNPLTVSPIVTTNYTVTGTTAGCTSTAVATVLVNPNLTLIVNNPTICLGETATLTVTGATTYTWSTGTFGTSLLVSPSSNTSYTINGVSGVCTGSTIATVSVNPLPVVTVNTSTICEGQSATLTSVGATTYSWNTGSSVNPLTVSPIATTDYTVTGTLAGCTNSAVASVSVNPLPLVTVNSSTICVGQSTTLTPAGATTYTWNTGSTLNPLTVSPISTINYTITGTASGCTNTTVATVSVNPLPIVTVNSSTICVGQSATLTSVGATTYTWDTGSLLNSLTVSPISNTNYTVTGSSAGCTNTAVSSVSVNSLPLVTVNSSTICEGQVAILTSAGATTYSWNTGSTLNPLTVSPLTTTDYTVTGTSLFGCSNSINGTVVVIASPTITALASQPIICEGGISNLSAFGAVNYTWSAGGALTSTVSVSPVVTSTYTVTGSNGIGPLICSNSQTVLVTVIPQTTVIASVSHPICVGESEYIYAEGGDTYSWLPTLGVSNPSAFSTLVKPTTTTIYTVTASHSGLCPGTATLEIIVHPLPYVYAGVDTTINMDETYVLQGIGDVPVGFLSPNSFPLICNYCSAVEVSPKETTCYTLKGETEFGCVAYDEVCINVTKDWNVYIPNAFSPNGDSDNDVFIPVGYGLSEIKLYIFDRWGVQIFKSHDDVVGWNGDYKEDPCKQDVYVYKAEIKTMSGLKFFRTGHVTLLSNLK